jgi:hypothetical protein
MAKFSVSIPDPLKETLDHYVETHHLSVSVVVQQALTQLFSAADQPTPQPTHPDHDQDPDPNLTRRLTILEKYFQGFLDHYELLRLATASTPGATDVPPPFPRIPLGGKSPTKKRKRKSRKH